MLDTRLAGITTSVVHNENGSAQVLAKGFGKQRTISYDHSRSHEANHGLAAGTLALALKMGWSDSIVHTDLGGGKHKFSFPG